MTPKEFISVVFLNELKELSYAKPYISFAVMATGIEFLGKCLDTEALHWNEKNKSKINFEYAMNNLEAFSPYRRFLDSHKMWDSLRNGFSHSFVPKYPITLSSKNELGNLALQLNDTRLNLKCEDFYSAFAQACLEVVNMNFPNTNDKMNKQLLSVPNLEE